MTLQVRSEIGRLRRVLIHKPGREIDWMVPTLMDHLLFDDILYGDDARWEHEHFEAVLRAAEVETFDPLDLLVEVLADDGPRGRLLEQLQQSGVEVAVIDELASLSAADLAVAAIGGLEAGRPRPGGSVRDFYRLAPLPNYFFQRDPQVVLGDRVLVSSMATDVRDRESLLSSLVFEHHPALGGWQEMIRLHDSPGPIV
ncbi:MAG: arginine deiminase family protein, partial [Acidobacteriota bacterium]